MATKIKPYQKNESGGLDEYKFASTGSIVDLNEYTPYSNNELDNIPDVSSSDDVNTAFKKVDGKARALERDKADADHTHNYAGASTPGGAATSADKLSASKTIDGVNFDGSAAINHYGACSTSAGTAAKTVDCVGFTLTTGSKITVKFAVTNTAANPTLNVNGSGAKAMHYRGAAIDKDLLVAGRVYDFVYDGTQYQLVGDLDTVTTYTASDGVSLTNNNFTNSGVRSVSTGTANGTIAVNTGGTSTDVAVSGLASGAFTTAYEHPTTAGNKHIPEGGSSGQVLQYGGTSGTAVWANVTNYTASDGVALENGNFTNSGVRSVSSGATNGTIAVNTGGTSSEVAVHGLGSAAYTSSTDYASAGHSHAGTDIPLTGYSKPSSTSAIAASDTVNSAVGKLEKALDGKAPSDIDTGVMSVSTGSANGTIAVDGSDVAVKGLASGAYAAAYTHPTTAGNKHIPSGGSSGQILKYSADGTATWAAEYSYTHPTTAGNKHIPTGGSSGQVLKYGGSSGTAAWATLTASDVGAAPSTIDTGVMSVTEGSTNGTVSVDGTDIAVHGLASGAYSAAYTHPTTAGNKHIPSGGSSGQILKYSADGTAVWANEYSYTHPTSAGNKHIPTGGSTGQVLKYGGSSGTASWATLTASDVGALASNGTAAKATADASGNTITTTYATKAEVSAIPKFAISVVDSLPATGDAATIYLVTTGTETDNLYTEYIYVDDAWEKLGTQKVDLSGYTLKSDITTGSANGTIAVAGTNVSVKGLASGAYAAAYTHPTTAGNKHIPSGGSSGQILKYGGSSGTATWANEYSYTHPASGATAGDYGPSADVTGTNNTTISVPAITVDANGHVTSISNKTYTSKDTVYSHPTTAGNKHIPTGGSSGQVLKYSASGTAAWATLTAADVGAAPSTIDTGVMSVATGSTNGTLSVDGTDVAVKGLASGAYAAAYTHPTTAGNKHIPSGGSSGQVLKYGGSSGTASWATLTAADVGAAPSTIDTGVMSVSTGSTNGTLSVDGTDVAVKGLGSAAYTASTAYAAASHGNHVPATQTANNAVFLRNDNSWQTVTPANIGAAASSHTHSNYLTAHQTIKQDAVTGATGNRFGTCGTAASTAAKTVSITAGTPALEAGLRVTVKFTYANTAGTPTLNVNSLGAKNIFHNGAQITTGANKALLAGTCDFVYDGTQFHLVGNYIDTNTTYSGSNGISLSGTTFSNSGVRSVATGSTNGTISVNTNGTAADVAVKGLGSAAYTASTAYAAASHGNHVPATQTANNAIFLRNDNSWQTVTPANIGAAASNHTHSNYLTSHQTIKQDAVTGATGNRYGACSTAAATAAKTVSITAGTPALEAGLKVTVKFANANTANSPTLNVNSLGAKNIFHNGAQITTGANKALLAGVCDFVYDGTQFHLVGNYLDTNTTYSGSNGISLSGTTFSNSGVRSVATGSSNGTISVNTNGTAADVAVKGLGSAAYTASTAYATSGHNHDSVYLKTHQTIKQDAVTGATANRYGACSTAAATAAKTVSVTAGTPTLETGLRVTVKFANANTASSPTLNVNSTGAKNIFHNGAQITTGANKALLAGVCDFVYDGTQYHLVGNYIDTNTQTVTGVKGNSESSYRTGNVNITAANIGAAASNHNHNGTYTPYAASVGSNQKFIYTNSSGVLTAANFEIWVTDT